MIIAFYFPSHGVGGSEFLFIRYAQGLVNAGHEVWFVDFEDGFSARRLRELGVQIRHIYCDENRKVTLPAGADILVINSYDLFAIPKIRVSYNLKLAICEVHPVFWNFRRTSKLLFGAILKTFLMRMISQKIINNRGFILLEKMTLSFMKEHGLRNLDRLGIVLIPVDGFTGPRNYTLNSSGAIVIASVGRAVSEKIVPTSWAYSKIQKMGIRCKLVFITDERDKARRLWLQYTDSCDDVDFVTGLNGKKLDRFLEEKVDIFLGMATTTLEAGKLGIPSVVIDRGAYPYPSDAKVKMLYESNDLGALSPDLVSGWRLEDALKHIRENYPVVSAETYQFVLDNHGLGSVTVKLLESLNACEQDFNELRFSFLYQFRVFLIRCSLVIERLRRRGAGVKV